MISRLLTWSTGRTELFFINGQPVNSSWGRLWGEHVFWKDKESVLDMFILEVHWTSKRECWKAILGMKAWLKWVMRERGSWRALGHGALHNACAWLLAPGLLPTWVVWAQVLTAMSAGFFLVSGTLRLLHLYCEPRTHGFIVSSISMYLQLRRVFLSLGCHVVKVLIKISLPQNPHCKNSNMCPHQRNIEITGEGVEGI